MEHKTFGDYIKKLRTDRNLTIHQVETYCGVSNSYISLIERNKRNIPSNKILKKLASIYKVSLSELIRVASYFSEETIYKVDYADGKFSIEDISYSENKDFSLEDKFIKSTDLGTITIKNDSLLDDSKKIDKDMAIKILADFEGLTPEDIKIFIEAAKNVKEVLRREL